MKAPLHAYQNFHFSSLIRALESPNLLYILLPPRNFDASAQY